MRVLFYTLFYTIMCNATNPTYENNKIFNQELNGVEERGEPTATSFDDNSRMRNVLKNERKTKPKNTKKFPRDSLLNPSAKYEEKPKIVSRRSTNPEYPSQPFYLLRHPEHVGDGARLRLDFVRPCGSNGSSKNFRGSAEVVAGQWRLPPSEYPLVLDRSKNLGDDFEPGLSTGGVNPPGETRGTKKPGFFKSVGEFFKHSFHIDKTTAPISSTTSKTPGIDPPEASDKVFAQRRNQVFQGREDLGKGGVTKFLKNRKPFKGRDVTFNLRIKAVAVPRLPGVRKAGS